MKPPNNHDENIHCREPLLGGRRKRRGFPVARYNDGSAEVGAMNAHLRAVAYGGQKAIPTVKKGTPSLLDLSREYDAQARHNFTTEAMIFAVITIVAIAWPFVQSMQILARSVIGPS